MQDYYSEAGHFVVVNYSVTNTSSGTIQPNPIGALHVGTEANIEVYEQSDEILPAGHDVVGLRMDEIPPRQMRVSQFIFDVPTDVDPELVAVTDEPTITSSFDVGVVDLTENEPQGPRPQEIVALMNEYINMTAWEQAYELYSEESKARVSLDAYESRQATAMESVPASTQDISFPSVDVQENQATVDSVLDLSDEEGEFQDKITYELVLEEDGWRIVMSQKAVDFILGTGEETTSSNASASGSASASP